MVSLDLPAAFAGPAAYGDLATSMLALLAIAMPGRRAGNVIVWVFNSVGTVDLLNAFYQGDRLTVGMTPGLQGAAYSFPTVLVPLLLVTHALVFPNPAWHGCTGRSAASQTHGLIADFRERAFANVEVRNV